ncbi:MAG: FtsX-like permease family protein [Gammaproteobacteria bacterium]|jgi:cell division transport system permease protein|nr:FtsX-like permease family protein [Gammaproteobacteria bacterium]
MAVTRNADAVAPVRSSGPFSIWLARHIGTAIGSLGRLVRHPFSSLMIVLVIAVTLALPAAINLVVKNARSISTGWDNALDFAVFLNQGLSESEAEGLGRLIEQRADVDSVEFISATQALVEFKEQSGFGQALDQLPDNPLPHTLVVRPSPGNNGPSMVLLQEELTNLPETDHVQVDTEWVQRFHAILDIVRQAVAIGAALLGIAIVVIIGNTIRLDIENRRNEIEVTKLLGATNAFVRRPFLWTGFWYGLLGGLMALALVYYGLFLLQGPVERLAGLYQSNIAVAAMSLVEAAAIVGVGVFLGLFGSWFTAARHMRRIEPR